MTSNVHRARRRSLRIGTEIAALAWGLTACRFDHLVGIGISSETEDATGSSDGIPETGNASSSHATGSSSEGSSPTTTATGETTSPTGPLEPDLPLLEETGPLPDCEAPPGHSECDTSGDPFQTIGLDCNTAPTDSTPIDNERFESADPNAWRSASTYGNASFEAIEGQRLLVLTTGELPAADGAGSVTLPIGPTRADDGNNGNPDGETLPAPISTLSGSGGEPFVDCDGTGDCSESLPGAFQAANDLVYFRFDTLVPPGTFGYQVDLAWFSAEFPERTGAAWNDLFVWWQSSEKYTGNVAAFLDQPMSATGLAAFITAQTGVTGNAPLLGDTGFGGTTTSPCEVPGHGTYAACPRGATTGWLTLRGPTNPSEILTTVVALFDQGDENFDTTVLIDNWRWDCEGCERVGVCGLGVKP